MIVALIKELKNRLSENKKDLYARLVKERLDLALKAYYTDLITNFDSYNTAIDNTNNILKITKKLIKD